MRTHVVGPNDTLTRIAQKYETSVSALVSLNKIKNRNLIIDGQVLKIPDPPKKASVKEPAPAPAGDLLVLVENLVEKVENLPEFLELMERL